MLPFVPRKVAKSLRSTSNTPQNSRSHASNAAASAPVQPVSTATGTAAPTSDLKGKTKEQPASTLPDTDFATLLTLGLTSYALWSNPDLRRKFETSEEGYIPLSYVVSSSEYLRSLHAIPSEAVLVKALRAHAADTVEVRMRMTTPSRAEWYGRHASSKELGGYEIRLKDCDDVGCRAGEDTKQSWDAKTLYVENIPSQYRSLVGIYRFVTSLLPGLGGSEHTLRVQNITLPRHHLDKPTDIPKCKGFSLVTFANTEDVAFLSKKWPWRRDRTHTLDQDTSIGEAEISSERREALRFGFRVLEKAQWEKLNQEYLAYRQRLLEEIARAEESIATSQPTASEPHSGTILETPSGLVDENATSQTNLQEPLDASTTYPSGCLVFVRHVHPETNKTTLRKLFSRAFETRNAPNTDDAIDYVDFNKGMDTCYLRLVSRQCTQALSSYFTSNRTAQTQGLDDTGSTPSPLQKAITVEIVSGEREELYWGKVPEKVRQQALEKATKATSPQESRVGEPAVDDEEKKTGRKRKRRRG